MRFHSLFLTLFLTLCFLCSSFLFLPFFFPFFLHSFHSSFPPSFLLSHILLPDRISSSLYSSYFLPFISISPNPFFLFLFHKRSDLSEISTKHCITISNKTRDNSLYQGCATQPSRKQRVPRVGKWLIDGPYSHHSVHKNTKLCNHNIYPEDISQTYIGPLVFLLSLVVPLWYLFSWFCELCSFGVLESTDSLIFSSSFHLVPWALLNV